MPMNPKVLEVLELLISGARHLRAIREMAEDEGVGPGFDGASEILGILGEIDADSALIRGLLT